ncbi:MAG: peptidylprolyl isomerase [Candidatus Bathyarchaeota archaeon]|jgi:cyclophilin family peptidyl-prolyl cis-trans isomerase|nr:peptidylprolyl isomerase [Candidatus Bathyarchaeota archaeon]
MSIHSAETVVLETTKGNIEIELNRTKAPVTVDNFVKYVKEGFFDNTIFHRVIPGFMIQGGGFAPDGTQKRTRQPIKLESKNGLKNTAGTIAMARTNDPDSATSQFFINLIDNSFLNTSPSNQGYAVFGSVTAGMENIKAIAAVKIGTRGPHQDWPKEDIVIKRTYMK